MSVRQQQVLGMILHDENTATHVGTRVMLQSVYRLSQLNVHPVGMAHGRSGGIGRYKISSGSILSGQLSRRPLNRHTSRRICQR